jgi:hypothetical protein
MDQVLLQMAKKIGDFLPYIGGPEYAHHLVALIESLCNIEEITIRSAAAASACKIIAQLSSTHIQSIEAFFQLFQRLSNEETGDLFYGRVCACFMIAEVSFSIWGPCTVVSGDSPPIGHDFILSCSYIKHYRRQSEPRCEKFIAS